MWKNPLVDSASKSKFVGNAGTCLKRMRTTATIDTAYDFSNDAEVSGDSNAKGWIDFCDSDTIWYHQDEQSGFTPFRGGETISLEGLGGTKTVRSYDNLHNIRPDIDRFSGELFFINNSSQQTRTAASTDDVKLVIQL